MSRTDDLVEIQQVAALYGHVIDAQQWDRLGEVYAEDATYHGQRSGVVEGLAAIRAYLSSHEQARPHIVSNVNIELDEGSDAATGVAKFLAIRSNGVVFAGDYSDEWARTTAGWRLQHRQSRITAPADEAAAAAQSVK